LLVYSDADVGPQETDAIDLPCLLCPGDEWRGEETTHNTANKRSPIQH
jgi:hypothetical protein